MFYIPPILVVSTFSQHIISRLYECSVLLCQCLCVYIFAMCKYMLSDFRKRISILLVILVLSFAFIHISCVIQMVWDILVLCFYIELSSNKIFRMTASTLSTCVTAKILNLSSLEQLQHVFQWFFFHKFFSVQGKGFGGKNEFFINYLREKNSVLRLWNINEKRTKK